MQGLRLPAQAPTPDGNATVPGRGTLVKEQAAFSRWWDLTVESIGSRGIVRRDARRRSANQEVAVDERHSDARSSVTIHDVADFGSIPRTLRR